MASKELKKLRRKDLLEMLLSLSKENEELRQKLETAETKLKNREIILNDSESLAEACLRLSGFLETTQKARVMYKASVYQNCEQIKK